MDTCRLPIHVRFILCDLNEASVRVLANSLLANSSLIGFTCLFHPSMVEERFDGGCYHAPKSTAAQCVRDAVMRTLSPLQIWDNCDDIILIREKLKLRTLLCSLPFTNGPAKYLPVEIIRKIIELLEERSDSKESVD